MAHLKEQVIGDIAPQRVGSIRPPKVGSRGLRVVIQPCDLSLQNPTARIEDLIYQSLVAVSLPIDLQPWADYQHSGLVMNKIIIGVVPSCCHVRSTWRVEDAILPNGFRSPLPSRQRTLRCSPLIILLFTVRRIGRMCPHIWRCGENGATATAAT